MFSKAVRISVNICPTDQSRTDKSPVHTISIVLESGPVHRFKKLCEKLQLILLSNTRRSTSNCRADEEVTDERSLSDDKRSCSEKSKLQLAQLSDTESEGELLEGTDSPRKNKKTLKTVNGNSGEKQV